MTGLGIQLQIAESNGTPIILCFRDFGSNKVETVSYENPDHSRHTLQVGEGFVTLMALGCRRSIELYLIRIAKTDYRSWRTYSASLRKAKHSLLGA
jgi:hypothetical protein